MNKQEYAALRLCVESLDQLLPHLAKVPADIGLLNEALVAARPLLKGRLPMTPPEEANYRRLEQELNLLIDLSGIPKPGDTTDYLGGPDLCAVSADLREWIKGKAEPAPTQGEREAFEAEARKLLYVLDREAISGEYIVPDTENAWQLWRARDTRPAQTEQQATVKDCLTVQPMAYAVFAANGNAVCFSTRRDHPSLVALEKEGHSVVSLAPIAQTAPQPEHSGLNDDSKEAAMQKAFELGGLEDGSYHLESDELELVIRSALSAQGETHE